MHYYQREIKDIMAKTAHLSMIEHGAYARIFDAYILNERPLKTDEIYRATGAITKHERIAIDSVLGQFYHLVEGVWRNDDAEKILDKFHRRQSVNRQNATGKNGGKVVPINPKGRTNG